MIRYLKLDKDDNVVGDRIDPNKGRGEIMETNMDFYYKGWIAAINQVLKIIEQIKAENNEINGEPIRTHFEIEYNDFRERVLALKGCEHEISN